jgi:pyruvate carboxylase
LCEAGEGRCGHAYERGCGYAGDISNPAETKYTLEYYMKMVDAIVAHGCHAIGIKDMAGLLKPNAATTLVSALRAAHPDVVIHVHTHDSAGTAVATQLAAAAAGADIVDLAMDAMSGCTSQVRAHCLPPPPCTSQVRAHCRPECCALAYSSAAPTPS